MARFGDDEFALLLPNAGQSTVVEIEARLRMNLSGLTCRPTSSEMPIPITVSVGAALFTDIGQDRYEVLRLADERLLRAKTGADAETAADQVRTHTAGTVSGFSMLDALVTAVDNKDRYTRHHKYLD